MKCPPALCRRAIVYFASRIIEVPLDFSSNQWAWRARLFSLKSNMAALNGFKAHYSKWRRGTLFFFVSGWRTHNMSPQACKQTHAPLLLSTDERSLDTLENRRHKKLKSGRMVSCKEKSTSRELICGSFFFPSSPLETCAAWLTTANASLLSFKLSNCTVWIVFKANKLFCNQRYDFNYASQSKKYQNSFDWRGSILGADPFSPRCFTRATAHKINPASVKGFKPPSSCQNDCVFSE